MTGLFTAAELQTCSLDQLYGLYRRIERELLESDPGTHECRIALASLDNIAHAICIRQAFHDHLRRSVPPRPKPGF